MNMSGHDSNVAFTLTQNQRGHVMRSLASAVAGMPSASAILIDHAGRIVEEVARPTGVNLPAISALAAGCYATTHELAKTVGQPEYSLLFQHDNGQQVFIWPVSGRALLVALLNSAAYVPELEGRLAGEIGRELLSVIASAQEPERRVPPPKVVLADIPADVRRYTRDLATLLMDLQNRSGGSFSGETSRYLLLSREELIQALGRSDWKEAIEICVGTRTWLSHNLGVLDNVKAEKVVPVLYRDLLAELHKVVSGSVAPERLEQLYRKFYVLLARKWTRVFVSESCVSADGIDAVALWKAGVSAEPDADLVKYSSEFVGGMDEMVRELLRIVYLAKGVAARNALARELAGVVDKYRDWLLPLGLDGVAGRNWAPLGLA